MEINRYLFILPDSGIGMMIAGGMQHGTQSCPLLTFIAVHVVNLAFGQLYGCIQRRPKRRLISEGGAGNQCHSVEKIVGSCFNARCRIEKIYE